ncbi:MAG: 4-hydroxy-tetrahydrodipicolinate reductase [Ilumatobacteraceae bacterium]
MTAAQRRVGVIGGLGRMGSAVCDAVQAADGLELAAVVSRQGGRAGAATVVHGVPVADAVSAVVDAQCDVVVDFTLAAAARVHVPFLAEHGIHAVVGTTGLGDDDVAHWRAAFTRSNCIVSANFAISAVLMMRFAELAAPHFDTAEIIELHHDRKADAPSGTAMSTARRMAAASPQWAADPTTHLDIEGARGAAGPGGIRIHSVRMRGMVAHQEVVLGAAGQTLTLRQDSYDRISFMPGVVLACRRVDEFPGVTLGLDALLGI